MVRKASIMTYGQKIQFFLNLATIKKVQNKKANVNRPVLGIVTLSKTSAYAEDAKNELKKIINSFMETPRQE